MYKKTMSLKLADWRAAAALGLGLLLLVTVTLGLGRMVVAQMQPVSAEKTAWPEEVPTGGTVIYTVLFTNNSDDPVDLTTITDTLPTGFRFAAMNGDSDITEDPSGPPEQPVWDGDYTVPARESVDLVYDVLVEAPPSGTPYTNTVEAMLDTGETISAQAGVTVPGPNLVGSKVPRKFRLNTN
jgi:uncharacterized repeat protein (TIGR01451 family)